VAALLAEVHQQHLYRRDDGGFQGWVEGRLSMSRRTAYKLLDVHGRFGSESVHIVHTLPRSVLYLLAPESTPEAIRAEVIQRAEAGEHFTRAQVKELIDKAAAEAWENGAADQAAIAQAAKDEADKYEKKLAAATEKYNAEVGRLRTELASALSPEELQRAIDEALAPLQDKIKRLEAERDKRKREAPTRRDEFGLRAQAITGALRVLAASLTITPPQMIEAAKFVSEVTSRPVNVVLADDVASARNVLAWLDQFLGAAK
jgi:aryl-alcohol dehydrogenase-like predicted oxidoreductase